MYVVCIGIQYSEIEYHINSDGTTTICNEPYNIFSKHTCKNKQYKKILGIDDILDSDYSTVELNDTYMYQIKLNTMCINGLFALNKPYLALVCGDGTCRLYNVDAFTVANIEEIKKQSIHKSDIYEQVKLLHADSNDENNYQTHNMQQLNGMNGDHMIDDTNSQPTHKKSGLTNGITNTSNTLSWCSYGTVNRSMISVDWSNDSSCIACGTYDNKLLLTLFEYNINDDNESIINDVNTYTITYHHSPVSVVRWNSGTNNNAFIASGTLDGTIALWPILSANPTNNITTYNKPIHTTTLHSAPIIDIQWRNQTSFASCSADGSLYINTLSNTTSDSNITALKLDGHTSDINQLLYNHNSTMLATCSDDHTVKVWNSDTGELLHTFTGHTKEVTCIAWITSTIDDSIPSPSLLASGSLDSTIRVWDITASRCVGVLGRQLHPITSLVYNSTAQLLAAAAYQRVYIFSIVDGSLLHTYAPGNAYTNTCINYICWDVPNNTNYMKLINGCVATGQRLFVSYSDNNAYIIDLRAGSQS